jgi:hypothetical protein
MFEQPEAIPRGVPVRERLTVELGLPESPLVPRDHAELGSQSLDLGREHLSIHQKSVRQDHRRTTASGVIESDALTIYLRKCHQSPPFLRSVAANL